MTSFSTLNRRYTFEKTLLTNITSEYVNDSGSKWGVWESVRESIQNMLDEADRLSRSEGRPMSDYYKFEKKFVPELKRYTHLEFRDKGEGVDFEKIFFLGASVKRGQDFKGHKGEGEVLSFLVAARDNLEKWMFSKTWAVTPKLVSSGGYLVLALDFYVTNKPIEGTVWRYDLTPETEEIFHNIGEYFPELSKRALRKESTKEKREREEREKAHKRNRDKVAKIIEQKSTTSTKCILIPKNEARLYVRGVYVKGLHANFSYNLNVEINRDRSMVDEFQILEGIQAAFNSDDLTKAQCEMYWKNCQSKGDLFEYRQVLRITKSSNFVMMRDAFKKVFGKRSFVPTVPVATLDAETSGWTSIDLPNYVKDTALHLGIDTDKSVMGYIGDVVPLTLNRTQERLIEKLKEIGKQMGLKSYPVFAAKKSLGDKTDSTLGFYKNGEITLFERALNGDRLELLSTYIHECGHGDSGAGDGTRAFTDWFERILIKALTGKHDKVRPLIDELLKI